MTFEEWQAEYLNTSHDAHNPMQETWRAAIKAERQRVLAAIRSAHAGYDPEWTPGEAMAMMRQAIWEAAKEGVL